MLQRYGGPLSLATFYGTDAEKTEFKAMRAPPLASFAMYMECVRGSAQETRIAEMPSMESLRNLRRPLQREFPLVTRQPTGRPPLLLELLATKFFELGLGSSAQSAAAAPASDSAASAHELVADSAAAATEPKATGKRSRAARTSQTATTAEDAAASESPAGGAESSADTKRVGAGQKRGSARKGKDEKPSMGLQGFFTRDV
jgi:hypothetical protein